jgi:D-3-phosphoglycerate dehydrogenase / 2-oxoglutarate reductase
MKVYVLDAFHPAGVDWLKQQAGVEVVQWDDSRRPGWHEHADAVMIRSNPLTAEDFAKAANKLKVVSKQGVGVNTMDLAAAKKHGITICNTPGVNSEAVAEMALGMILDVGRRLTEMDRLIRAGKLTNRADFLGTELWEKTVGIIGMGNIGTRVARKLHFAFNNRILAYDPYKPAGHWADIPHQRLKSLDEMWAQVDVLTVHVPLTDETRGMVGAKGLARMKPSATVVNVSRGGIVDEKALYAALKEGRIFGAGLDVWDGVEPPATDDPLLSLPNVVATPHAAGGTRDTQVLSSMAVARQLLHVMQGNEPFHRVV